MAMKVEAEIEELDNSQISKEASKKELKELEEEKERKNLKKKQDSKKREPDLVDILKIIAPGTAIRTALNDILRANLGALIVVEKEDLYNIIEGGFRVNCKFSHQKLVELAKMDGAIILSKDLKKIRSANVLLVPSIGIQTKETGTRSKAAERTAKQIKTLVIAVSERKKKVIIYYKDLKYELEESSEILRKAAETLQMLEKQKEVLNELLSNLNILEVSNLVNVSDVSSLLQRIEIVNRISNMLKRYLIELGKEGVIVNMRLRELTKNLNKEERHLFRDYFGSKYLRAKSILKNMNFDFLIETQNISRMLFDELNDRHISPKGIRILNKTNLSEKEIKSVLSSFNSLDKILNADEDSLLEIFKKKEYVSIFKKEIDGIKEKIMIGKII